MKTIYELLVETNFKQGTRLRYSNWCDVKYMTISSICFQTKMVSGNFDNGEVCKFSFDSDFWKLYQPGMENDNMLV